MNVRRADLLKALKKALPGIDQGKVPMEGMDHFIFENGHIRSYNTVISVMVPLECDDLVKNGIKGSVSAKEFYGIIAKFKEPTIDFVIKDDRWILQCGRAKAELILLNMDVSGWLKSVSIDETEWQEVPFGFFQGLSLCCICSNKSTVGGVHVTSKDISSTDGFQIRNYRYECNDFDPFWISENSVKAVVNMGVLSYIQVNKEWAHFKTPEDIVISVRPLNNGAWPYAQIMDVLKKHERQETDVFVELPSGFFDAVNRASNFQFNLLNREVVRLEIKPTGVIVAAERSSGNYEEFIEWDEPIETDIFEVFIDPDMMINAGKKATGFYISKVKGSVPRIVMLGDDTIHLLSTFGESTVVSENITEGVVGNNFENEIVTETEDEDFGDDDDFDEDGMDSEDIVNESVYRRERREKREKEDVAPDIY